MVQVSAVQKLETKQIQLRETYERQKMDVQNLTVEKKQLEKHLDTKVLQNGRLIYRYNMNLFMITARALSAFYSIFLLNLKHRLFAVIYIT